MNDLYSRYERQILMFGKKGQKLIENSNIIVSGVGGIGSVIATYLVSLGVGKLTLIDNDIVEFSNLNRQFLHSTKDINKKKVVSAYEKLSNLNPNVDINTISEDIENVQISEIINKNTIIVDALDSISSRFYLMKKAIKFDVPMFHGAVFGFSGQVSTFIPNKENPCLFCFITNTNKKEKIPIVGSTVGIIGSIQCNEIIKYITKSGDLLTSKILIWNGLENSINYIKFKKDPNCPICSLKDDNDEYNS